VYGAIQTPWEILFFRGAIMKKRTIILRFLLSISALMLTTSTALASSNDMMVPVQSDSEMSDKIIYNEDNLIGEDQFTDEDQFIYEEQFMYEDDINYLQLMIRYTTLGDYESMRNALASRNAKIIELQLDASVLTEEEFLTNFESYSGFWCGIDYINEMVGCCLSGDLDRGRAMAKAYNTKLDVLENDDPRIDFDELFLLSKIITWEAGSSWLSMEHKMAVGEVLLNRVASPEFPNTLYECVYQRGQYSGSHTEKFQKFLPWKDCVEAALRLLQGERVLNEPKAIFQANFKQGSDVYKTYPDGKNRVTYICLSKRPWLYH